MGWFTRKRRQEREALVASLSSDVREMQDLLHRRPLVPPTDPPRYAEAEEIDRIADRLEDRMADLDHHLQRLDQRITAISTELANQLAELSADLDARRRADEARALGEPVEPIDVTDISERVLDSLSGSLDELRAAQVHLANEQTRYQIALREDLARLAGRIKG